MPRYQIKLAYHGSGYHGFQSQPQLTNIQDTLEAALKQILGEKIALIPSGRTDTGVHALQQVVHLDIRSQKALQRLKVQDIVYKLNCVLPEGLCVTACKKVRDKFHARHDVHAKTYQYHILLAAKNNPFVRNFVWCVHKPLDQQAMQVAAKSLIGRHDFSAFCASDSNATDKTRTMHSIRFDTRKLAPALALPSEHYLNITFCGEGFLKQMVRNIVGTLVDVGLHKTRPEQLKQILKARDRKRAGPTAPAKGLFLKKVTY